MEADEKELAWLSGAIDSPPLSPEGKREAGFLLRRLQRGESLSLPHSRPMSSIGRNCHELRIVDKNTTWRIVYRIDSDAIVLLAVFAKKTQQTPKSVIDTCKARMKEYDS